MADDESWLFNPVLNTHLHNLGITVPESLPEHPQDIVGWVRSQLTNRGTVELGGYIGLFSSQQMVIQDRFEDPRLCHVLAKNPVIQAKLDSRQTEVVQLGETTDAGLEDLGMVLPCDDSQLRVVQLSDRGCSLQVEGPPGTGKSQTIANIISNALWRGRSVLLVCDKKTAITQVEERLADAGLQPALLNLHDEGLDKKQFLQEAIERFSAAGGQVQHPFAITRSRSGMTVVSSLTSADLASSGATSEGFRCFKAFLQDLEAAASVGNFGITAQRFQKRNNGVSNIVFCDSPFEEQVVEFLENQGFTELECQHGCGKFRIDIVVKDRGKNRLAIECNGAAYHSSLVARTRDRARQRILEDRGWRGRIHRVWSTNWWYFEQQEKEAILAAIAAARRALQLATTRARAPDRSSEAPATAFANEQQPPLSSEDSVVPVAPEPNSPSNADETLTTKVDTQPLRNPPQPQLGLESPQDVGESRLTATELRKVLYQVIPNSRKIGREKLLEAVSQRIGVSLKKALSELNRMISEERSAGRLEVTPGSWDEVWRA